jgi:hypothetical protein
MVKYGSGNSDSCEEKHDKEYETEERYMFGNKRDIDT